MASCLSLLQCEGPEAPGSHPHPALGVPSGGGAGRGLCQPGAGLQVLPRRRVLQVQAGEVREGLLGAAGGRRALQGAAQAQRQAGTGLAVQAGGRAAHCGEGFYKNANVGKSAFCYVLFLLSQPREEKHYPYDSHCLRRHQVCDRDTRIPTNNREAEFLTVSKILLSVLHFGRPCAVRGRPHRLRRRRRRRRPGQGEGHARAEAAVRLPARSQEGLQDRREGPALPAAA